MILTVFLFSIASVSASDTNETLMTSTKDLAVELSKANEKEAILTNKDIGEEKQLLTNVVSPTGTNFSDIQKSMGDTKPGDEVYLNSVYDSKITEVNGVEFYMGGESKDMEYINVVDGNNAVIPIFGSNNYINHVTSSNSTNSELIVGGDENILGDFEIHYISYIWY